jgi:hypothetical protein
VAVVKHLEHFPSDGVAEAVENVLAFDAFTPTTRALVAAVFQKHGVPVPLSASAHAEPVVRLGHSSPLPEATLVETWRWNGGGGGGGSGSGAVEANDGSVEKRGS